MVRVPPCWTKIAPPRPAPPPPPQLGSMASLLPPPKPPGSATVPVASPVPPPPPPKPPVHLRSSPLRSARPPPPPPPPKPPLMPLPCDATVAAAPVPPPPLTRSRRCRRRLRWANSHRRRHWCHRRQNSADAAAIAAVRQVGLQVDVAHRHIGAVANEQRPAQSSAAATAAACRPCLAACRPCRPGPWRWRW